MNRTFNQCQHDYTEFKVLLPIMDLIHLLLPPYSVNEITRKLFCLIGLKVKASFVTKSLSIVFKLKGRFKPF